MRSLAAFTVIVLAAPVVAGQPSPRLAGLLEQFEPYFRLVERYRFGDDRQAVDAVREFSAQSREFLERAVEAWKTLATDRRIAFDALAKQRTDLSQACAPRTFEAATLLHTVAGIVTYERGGLPLLEKQLEMARHLTGLRSESSPAAHAFDADWNYAVALFFHGQWALEQAMPYMEAALALSPADPDLLVAAARLLEARHTHRAMQLAHQYDPAATQSPRTIHAQMLLRAGANADIGRAEALLRKALAGENVPPMARLRFARVLQSAGRLEEAEAELRRVTSASSDEATGYLAHLFLARMQEDRGRSTDAAALYEAATRVRPRNQSARIALARLLAEAGRREEASELAIAALNTQREQADEPWWLYYYPDEVTLSVIVTRMRERLR